MGRIPSLVGALLALICLTATAASSSSLTWSWRNPAPNGDALNAIAFGGGTYVAAGQDGAIYMSTDGTTWSPESSVIGLGGDYLDAIFANGLFVLAGVDAAGATHVSTSSDGMTWADTKLAINAAGSGEAPHLALAFGNGIYVVGGGKGDATSPDGTTWTGHSQNFDDAGEPLEFANGVFITEGIVDPRTADASIKVLYSSDGVTWTVSTSAAIASVSGTLASDGSTFFLITSGGSAVYTSTDGNTWTKQIPSGLVPNGPSQVLWDGTRFVAMGYDNFNGGVPHIPISSASTDGIHWNELSFGPAKFGHSSGHIAAATGTSYVAVADDALDILQSADFKTWITASSGSSGPTYDFTDMIDAGGRFVAVGQGSGHRPAIAASTNGASWTSVFEGTTSGMLNSVAYGKGTYVAIGVSSAFSSTDGVNWKAGPALPDEAVSDLVYGNGAFVVFAGCPANCTVLSSTDGQTWNSQSLSADFTQTGGFTALGYDGTRFVSIGNSVDTDSSSDKASAPVYTSCDGTTWTHSADVNVSPVTVFNRIRHLSTGLLALGTNSCDASLNPSQCDSSTYPVVAMSTDSSNWTAVTDNSGFDLLDKNINDVAFASNRYYATVESFDDNGKLQAGHLMTSTDAVNWTRVSGTPIDAIATTLAAGNGRLVVAGDGGDIFSATVSEADSTSTAGVCTELPSVDGGGSGSGSSGSFDMLTLTGLLILFVARRRAGI